MHEEVLLAGGQGGLKAGKYHWMLHAYWKIVVFFVQLRKNTNQPLPQHGVTLATTPSTHQCPPGSK
jgi:hypothetical protein